jgi:hypothetical protein
VRCPPAAARCSQYETSPFAPVPASRQEVPARTQQEPIMTPFVCKMAATAWWLLISHSIIAMTATPAPQTAAARKAAAPLRP